MLEPCSEVWDKPLYCCIPLWRISIPLSPHTQIRHLHKDLHTSCIMMASKGGRRPANKFRKSAEVADLIKLVRLADTSLMWQFAVCGSYHFFVICEFAIYGPYLLRTSADSQIHNFSPYKDRLKMILFKFLLNKFIKIETLGTFVRQCSETELLTLCFSGSVAE
jgi:hypothetical protein